ncbi:MAG: hypothetical protein CMJ84_09555 [Planctomycetes bacterium]|jgi:hypothetical protein|nr:hypothetical protein [Planctomycetota bacterium]
MRRSGGPKPHCAFLLAVLLLLGACASGPRTTSKEFFQLTPESAANKSMQTRRFEMSDGDELLSASAAALQDLGFQVTESNRALGFLRAAKERSARERGQEWSQGLTAFFTTLLTVLCAAGGSTSSAIYVPPVDLHQQINASLIAHPLESGEEGARFEVRVMFYRLVWKGEGQSGDIYIPPGEQKMEMIRDAEIYQRFFARLNKSVFLEGERI